jgi:oxygen-independent coproporphyrinogen-3 oxidase
VALGLRRVDGLSRAEFQAEFGADPVERFADAVTSTVADGLLELGPDRIRLTAAGRLLASEALITFLPERAVVGAA